MFLPCISTTRMFRPDGTFGEKCVSSQQHWIKAHQTITHPPFNNEARNFRRPRCFGICIHRPQNWGPCCKLETVIHLIGGLNEELVLPYGYWCCVTPIYAAVADTFFLSTNPTWITLTGRKGCGCWCRSNRRCCRLPRLCRWCRCRRASLQRQLCRLSRRWTECHHAG